jgi:hypothetical protein
VEDECRVDVFSSELLQDEAELAPLPSGEVVVVVVLLLLLVLRQLQLP